MTDGVKVTNIIVKNNIKYYVDIDECQEGLHECNQICNDLTGRYYCTCHTGYHFTFDNHTCHGKSVIMMKSLLKTYL